MLGGEKKINEFDTISAISTPPGEGGIGIVRISGRKAFKIASNLFRNKRGERVNVSSFPSYSAHYGYVFDPKEGVNIDETILLIMHAPYTYTKEDIVEFQCHGGMFILSKILELVIREGARPAEPGEFTKRAYLNGRIDLTQAEAVLSLIQAKSDKARKISLSQLRGRLSNKLRKIEENILSAVSWLEAIISFPDEDITPLDYKELLSLIDIAISEEKKLLDSYDMGKILTQGVKTVIVGRPNVGKSSLLNTFLSEERAIVTPIAGTTRDSLRESITIEGILFNLIDTAGIIKTDHPLDKIGVERSLKEIADADLILFILDRSSKITEDDKKIIEIIKDKKILVVLNKSDLPEVLVKEDILSLFSGKNYPIIEVSALTEMGLDELKALMKKLVVEEDKYSDRGEVFLTNIRHKRLLEESLEFLKKAKMALMRGTPVDLVGLDLEEGLKAIYKITGKEYVESVIETVFANFCVGK